MQNNGARETSKATLKPKDQFKKKTFTCKLIMTHVIS